MAKGQPEWTVLTADFKDKLLRRAVDPKEPVLMLGNKQGPWEVEINIPQKHIGQVLQAYDYVDKDKHWNASEQEVELDVELILRSEPTKTYRGKLARSKIAHQADPHKDDNNEPEPVVKAWVRIEGDDIPANRRIDPRNAPTGTEVKAKILCGQHKMGYSLFYGVWEFLYEKLVFPYF